jgi:transcriptional regulator GlxA family with amidase domain
MSLHPSASLASARSLDIVFVCGGLDIRRSTGRSVLSALRQLAREHVPLGALCTGSFALAEAGLLSGYRCAIHWEHLAAIREEFPDIRFLDDLYTIDRDRITCTGGIAPLDLMLIALIGGEPQMIDKQSESRERKIIGQQHAHPKRLGSSMQWRRLGRGRHESD